MTKRKVPLSSAHFRMVCQITDTLLFQDMPRSLCETFKDMPIGPVVTVLMRYRCRCRRDDDDDDDDEVDRAEEDRASRETTVKLCDRMKPHSHRSRTTVALSIWVGSTSLSKLTSSCELKIIADRVHERHTCFE